MWSDSDECSDTSASDSASDWTCECCPDFPYGNSLPERAHSRIYSSNTVDKNWSIIVEINEKPYRERVPYRRRKNFIRSSCANILVKVESDLYHLDRVQLALKSDYFEKLFASDFYEKHKEMMEIQAVDSEIFSNVLDIIYGVNLAKVLCVDNYARLLVAMDYFQMEINLKIFLDFLKLNIEVPLCEFPGICELYDYTAENRNFEYFSPTLRQYLSIHLIEVIDSDEFAELSLVSLVKIIKNDKFPWYDEEKCIIGEICAKWICHDVGDRLIHLTDLVNAAKNRYDFPFEIRADDSIARHLLDINEESTRRAEVAKHFEYLLEFNTEISPGKRDLDEEDQFRDTPVHSIINNIDATQRWKNILNAGNFHDMAVKIRGKTYQLHRCKLNQVSDYFARLGPADKDEEHSLDEIDPTIFESIIDYIYLDEEIKVNLANITDALIAGHILKITRLIRTAHSYICANVKKLSNDCIVKILNFICDQKYYRKEFDRLRDTLVGECSKIGKVAKFVSIPGTGLINILKSPKLQINREIELADLCARWIFHDMKNRYHLMSEIVFAIRRNCVKVAAFDDVEKDVEKYTLPMINVELLMMISSPSLVPKENPDASFERHRMYYVAEPHDGPPGVNILDSDLNVIDSMHPLESRLSHLRRNYDFHPSGAIVGDNMFILSEIELDYFFCVYNLSLGKFFALNSDPRMKKWGKTEPFKLLNCRDQLYCCFHNGGILKYSIRLNRWTVFVPVIDKYDQVMYFSDGESLYMFTNEQGEWSFEEYRNGKYRAWVYDFVENTWCRMPEMPPQYSSTQRLFSRSTQLLTDRITAIGDLALVFTTMVYVFDPVRRNWCRIRIPRELRLQGCPVVAITTDLADDIFHLLTRKYVYRGRISKRRFDEVKFSDEDEDVNHTNSKKYKNYIQGVHRRVGGSREKPDKRRGSSRGTAKRSGSRKRRWSQRY